VNPAGGTPIQLVDLVHKIAEVAGIEVEITFDLTKQEGRRRKQADLTKLNAKMPAFRQTVNLEKGLADMIEWHERNRLAGTFAEPIARPVAGPVS
jgi:nucleoside-diphosphate-sugar epimerase